MRSHHGGTDCIGVFICLFIVLLKADVGEVVFCVLFLDILPWPCSHNLANCDCKELHLQKLCQWPPSEATNMYFGNVDISHIALLPYEMLTYSVNTIWVNNCAGLCVLLNSTYSSGATPACGGPELLLRLGYGSSSAQTMLSIMSSSTGFSSASCGAKICSPWTQSSQDHPPCPASSFCKQSKVAFIRVPMQKPFAYPISGGANGNFAFAVEELRPWPVNL